MQIIFETERLTICEYNPEQFELYFSLNGDKEIMQFIRPPQPVADARITFQKIISDYAVLPGMGRWPAYEKETGAFVGSFCIIPVANTDDFQVGYSLLKKNWGKGYASELVVSGLVYAFDQLKLEHIAGITFPENIASQKVLLKNGFVFEKEIVEDAVKLFLYRKRCD